jgi:hypothetical protein
MKKLTWFALLTLLTLSLAIVFAASCGDDDDDDDDDTAGDDDTDGDDDDTTGASFCAEFCGFCAACDPFAGSDACTADGGGFDSVECLEDCQNDDLNNAVYNLPDGFFDWTCDELADAI